MIYSEHVAVRGMHGLSKRDSIVQRKGEFPRKEGTNREAM